MKPSTLLVRHGFGWLLAASIAPHVLAAQPASIPLDTPVRVRIYGSMDAFRLEGQPDHRATARAVRFTPDGLVTLKGHWRTPTGDELAVRLDGDGLTARFPVQAVELLEQQIGTRSASPEFAVVFGAIGALLGVVAGYGLQHDVAEGMQGALLFGLPAAAIGYSVGSGFRKAIWEPVALRRSNGRLRGR